MKNKSIALVFLFAGMWYAKYESAICYIWQDKSPGGPQLTFHAQIGWVLFGESEIDMYASMEEQ